MEPWSYLLFNQAVCCWQLLSLCSPPLIFFCCGWDCLLLPSSPQKSVLLLLPSSPDSTVVRLRSWLALSSLFQSAPGPDSQTSPDSKNGSHPPSSASAAHSHSFPDHGRTFKVTAMASYWLQIVFRLSATTLLFTLWCICLLEPTSCP